MCNSTRKKSVSTLFARVTKCSVITESDVKYLAKAAGEGAECNDVLDDE